MKNSRFSDEQMVRLREADRGEVAETAKRHGISDHTIYVWRKRFGSMTPDDAKRLKALAGVSVDAATTILRGIA
jgi:putative transposase